ncbi:hypothetical protein [Actibacterium sp.]|uniref:hypothetical protein n=1 Tax=Actibacterium sp. TaxID=1872125 RepID=UPI00257ADB55|nr:hypothetical protein [Actibacterium sp.]
MTKTTDPNVVMGGRAMQIVADNHPERFTYENGHLFLDGSFVGDALTNALRPDTLLTLIRRPKAQEPMTDKRALQEMEAAKVIIDRHHDAGWLLGYHHEDMEGFVYRYADGRYEERARIAREETEDAA